MGSIKLKMEAFWAYFFLTNQCCPKPIQLVGEPIQPVKLFKLRASQACVKFSLSFNSWCLVDRGLVKVWLRPNRASKTPTITYSALITLIVIQLVELECDQLKLFCAILDVRACFMKIGEFLCILSTR